MKNKLRASSKKQFQVSFSFYQKLSNANLVARQFFKEQVTVVDTQLATLQIDLVVLEAARKAAVGTSKQEIPDHVYNFLIPNVQIVGVIPTLKYLQREFFKILF